VKYSRRRFQNSLLSIALTAVLLVFLKIYGIPLYRMQVWSGWILFTLILLLLIYNIRKKLPMLPLGRAAFWLQCHAYLGLVTCVMFIQHINFRFPSGNFEILFSSVFIFTAFTGIFGLILSRVIPKYLSSRGEEVLFERIPIFTVKLKDQSQALIKECVSATKSKVLFDYYQQHLFEYFCEPKNIFFHLIGSNSAWNKMLIKHRTFGRFLNDEENDYADKLLILMRQKNDLDYHYALQGLLKAWTFLHFPLSFALLVLSLLHVALVYAFVGGI
jgi:hypothetical protein